MADDRLKIVQRAFAAGADDRMQEVIDLLDADVEMPGAVGGLEEADVKRGRERRRGRASGVEIEADMAFIYSFNGGRISRIEPYMSQADAREAAGLQKG